MSTDELTKTLLKKVGDAFVSPLFDAKNEAEFKALIEKTNAEGTAIVSVKDSVLRNPQDGKPVVYSGEEIQIAKKEKSATGKNYRFVTNRLAETAESVITDGEGKETVVVNPYNCETSPMFIRFQEATNGQLNFEIIKEVMAKAKSSGGGINKITDEQRLEIERAKNLQRRKAIASKGSVE